MLGKVKDAAEFNNKVANLLCQQVGALFFNRALVDAASTTLLFLFIGTPPKLISYWLRVCRAPCRSVGLGRTRLFYPWTHEPEGLVGRLCSVSHFVGPHQGSGFDG